MTPRRVPVPGVNKRYEDLHEMVSFEDPTEQRTWIVDATFLRSSWKCIFGEGCKGVLETNATHLNQGCCSYGAHFGDEEDVAKVVKHAVRLTEKNWQFKKKANSGFLKKMPSGETATRRVDGACIFLNRPGFAGGEGCALHIGALEAGERPLDWKPTVCWQLPVHLEHSEDDTGWVTTILREWKRRDWGVSGDEFHWWCTDTPDAFVGRDPVYKYLRDEIVELVGKKVYDCIVELLERPRNTPLPHEAEVRLTARRQKQTAKTSAKK
ncbi:MAG: hypothetical protein ACKO36_08415 [Actinomycetota bacterium]